MAPGFGRRFQVAIVAPGTGEVLAEHSLCAPGESSIADEHYGRARPTAPGRKPRPRSHAETAFLALGPVAETWLRSAAASDNTRLGPELEQLAALQAAHGHAALLSALERAVRFGRWNAAGVRSILDAGTGVGTPTLPGQALVIEPPATKQRPLSDYRLDDLTGGAADGHRRARAAGRRPGAGLRRLKLAAMRRVAPELLVTAKTQRWAPEELLRALVETEIAARDASNTRLRGKQAAFPTVKTIEGFDLAASSIRAPTWDYLTSLEWISAKENLTLIGPAGTGKSHTLIALGHAAVQSGQRVRYFTPRSW